MFRQAPCLALLALFTQIDLFPLDPSLRVSQYRKEYWEVEQGLPHSYVTAIANDAAGYLLIGTDEGLARFDGLDFRPLPSAASLRLATSWISAILAGSDSTLWLGTFEGRLMQLRNGQVQAEYQTGSSIFDLRQDSTNTLWASTRNGVLRIANGMMRRVPELGPPLDTSWNVLSRDASGRLWIVTASGLYCASGGGISLRLQSRSRDEILTVRASKTGSLLVGTTRGLLRLSPEAGKAPVAVPGIAGPVVSLLEDRDGIVWAGTWGQGLFRLTDRGVDRWTTRDGLPEDFIRTMAEDTEGNLWIGMRSAGLGQWRDSRLIPLGPPEGLAGSFATTVAVDRSENLWLGTWRGGLYRMRNGVLESQPTPLPTLYFTVRALAFDRAGKPWVGNWEGLFQFDGKRYNHFASEPNAPYRRVSALLFDRNGRLWVGTADHGIFLFPNGRPAAPIPSPLLPDTEITALLEDSSGSIWVGTSKGLGKFAAGSHAAFSTFKNLPADKVGSIFEDTRKRIWAATSQGAIFVISPSGGAVVLDRRNGMPGQPLYRILEAADGSLWVSSSKGILEIPRESLDQVLGGQRQRLEMIVHDQNDGMRTIECHGLSQPAGGKARDGSLWFPTAQGFVQVRPAAPRRLPPPKPVIEDIETKEGSVATAPQVVLKAGARNVEIVFTALRFANSRGVQFRYRMTDDDSGWTDAGGQRSARYNQLPPGNHIFEVQARDPAGAWSEAASLTLRQQPRFLETGWFAMLVGLAISSLVIAIYRWRLHVVHSRYALVLDERNRIGREWHDTLVSGFSAISLQLEAAMARMKGQPDRAAEILDVTRKMVHHYRAEARRVIWDLRDSRPEGETLSGAVESALSRMQATRGFHGKLTVTGQPVELPPEMQHNLLRICQEAMSNAVRHGHPSNVEIQLAYTLTRLTAVVRDDGCGFSVEDPPGDSGHFGLTVMQERARRIGGRLSIASRPGEGTVVEAEIPLK